MAAIAREWPLLKVDRASITQGVVHSLGGQCGGLRRLRFDRCLIDIISRSIALAGRKKLFPFIEQPTRDRVFGYLQRSFFSTAHR